MNNMKSFKKYLITFLTEFVIIFLGILVYKLVSVKFKEVQFTEYNLFRRSMSLLLPLIMCGLGVSVPRFISKNSARNSILSVGMFIVSIVMIFIGTIMYINKGYFSFLFFGSNKYSFYIPVLVLMILGAGYHAIVYGFLRGKFQYGWANIIQFINIGLAPVVSVYFSDSIYEVLKINTIIWLVTSILAFVFLIRKNKQFLTFIKMKHDLIRLFYYGLPRVPGDFALLLLISIPSFIVLHIYDDFILSGYVAFSTTLLNLVGASFGPIGLILLPETNKLIKKKEFEKLSHILKRVVKFSIIIAFTGVLIFYLFSNFFLDVLISDSTPLLIKTSRLMMSGGIGYAVFLNLRSVLDAYYFKPVNSYNMLKSLLLLMILVLIIKLLNLPFEYLMISYSVSMSFLGFITYIQVKKIIKF